jgi:hypothetical protein
METLSQVKIRLQEKLQNYKRQIEMSQGCLVSHRWVMVVNCVYTVALDESGKTVLSTKNFPSQFTDEGAIQIENGCTFYNNKGEVLRPTRINHVEYYRQQVKEIEQVLGNLKDY